MVAAIAEVLVEHLEEDLQNRVAAVVLLSLAVDVEKDDLSLGLGHAPQISLECSVARDLLDEEIERRSVFLALFFDDLIVQEVRQNLDEM
jgi:hypothetical protein